MVSSYPLGFLVSEIIGDRGNIRVLAEYQDVHEYRLTPKDMVAITDADVLFLFGNGLEPWGEDMVALRKEKNSAVLEMLEGMDLYMNEDEKHDMHDAHEDAHSEHEISESEEKNS